MKDTYVQQHICTMINDTNTHVRKHQFQLSFVHYEIEKISQLKTILNQSQLFLFKEASPSDSIFREGQREKEIRKPVKFPQTKGRLALALASTSSSLCSFHSQLPYL